MEPITHFLTGACIGRAGFNRKTAYATLAATLAAEAADLDIVWGFAGPVEGFKHHRGITHTFWAVPIVAGVIVGAVWLFDRVRRARAVLPQKSSSPPADNPGGNALQPIHWGWLYLTAVIAALSHLLLDWTNNYGLRPFFPFNPHWYAGSFMFIAEPLIWALFFLAFFMPWVLGLADREMGARKQPFRGRGWATFALAGMTTLGGWRWSEHARARTLLDNVQLTPEPPTRTAFEPYPINPFHWHAILETAALYQTAEIDTRTGSIESDPARDVIYKPADTPAVEAAKRTLLGRVYLDWGAWAVIRDLGQEPAAGMDPPNLPPGRAWTTVEFTDLRFDYAFTSTRGPLHAPLGGWVYLVDGSDASAPSGKSSSARWEEAGEAMGGREQH